MRLAWPSSTSRAIALLTNQINWVGNWPLWDAVQLERHQRARARPHGPGPEPRAGRGPGGLPGRADAGVLPPPRVGRDPRCPSAAPAALCSRRRCGWCPGRCVPLVAGIWLALEVGWGHEGGAAKKQEKDYWRKNLATYRDAKVPDLKHVELDLDLFPERSRYHVTGNIRPGQRRATSRSTRSC